MNKEFIPYNLASALKELGFDEPCFAFKDFDHSLEIGDITKNSSWSSEIVSIPLYQQAFDWFLEKYNMFAETTLWGDGIGYTSTIKEIRQENFREVYNLGLATPNRGLPNWDKNLENLACLNRMLEIVKSKVSLDTDKWLVLVNPAEREDVLLSISSSAPDFTEFDEKSQRESYSTDHGTYEVIWEANKEQPIVRKFIE